MAKHRKRDISQIHPGEILKADFMEPLGLNASALSRAIGVPRTRLNDIVLGRRGISARFWMNLQSDYEPEVAEEAHGKRLDHEVPPHAASGTG